jgi:ABC-type uncharacterized transport system permease subunit
VKVWAAVEDEGTAAALRTVRRHRWVVVVCLVTKGHTAVVPLAVEEEILEDTVAKEGLHPNQFL